VIKLSTLKEHSDRYIRRVLRLHGGDVAGTARVLGMGRATLYRWCRAEGLELLEKMRERRQIAHLRRLAKAP
jgi:transcriptional regulator of acetoin/glycerol metabolism